MRPKNPACFSPSDHPEGGCEAEFAKSTAPFAHPRPDGLELMSDSFAEEMRRRLPHPHHAL
jgi:hypothetical protein